MAIIERQTVTSVGEDVEKLEPFNRDARNVNLYHHLGKDLKRLNIELTNHQQLYT